MELTELLLANHPFLLGDKRTAIAEEDIFLRQDGFRLEAARNLLKKFTLDIVLKKVLPLRRGAMDERVCE